MAESMTHDGIRFVGWAPPVIQDVCVRFVRLSGCIFGRDRLGGRGRVGQSPVQILLGQSAQNMHEPGEPVYYFQHFIV